MLNKKCIILIFILLLLLTGCKNDSTQTSIPTDIPPTTVMETTTNPVFIPNDDDYVKVLDYIPTIYIDLKYATIDNFTGQIIYSFNEAYLRYGTVKKLALAQQDALNQGYSIKIWDAYRPFDAQVKLWEVVSNPKYVANPNKGPSGHNIGNCIDITLVNLDGSEIEMPTKFDDFSLLADRDYSDVSDQAANHARILENIMFNHGFTGYSGEWWDYTDTTDYTYIEFVPKESKE